MTVEPEHSAERVRTCARCGHDPACGRADVYKDEPVTKLQAEYRDGRMTYYCHNDDHSCWEQRILDRHHAHNDGGEL